MDSPSSQTTAQRPGSAPDSERASASELGRAEALDRLHTTWAGARDGLWDWDLASGGIHFSERWKEILGFSVDELEDRPEEWFRRVHPRDLDELKRRLDAYLEGGEELLEVEFRVLHKDGGWRWTLCRASRHPRRPLLGGSLTDVTALKQSEDRLLLAAFHDPLTGLPNKELFLERLGIALSRRRRRAGQPPLAVLYVDLDRFHAINDSLGVDAGDRLLIELKDRMQRCLRMGDTLGRLGGDKFGLLLDGVRGPAEAERFAFEVANALRRPLSAGGHDVITSGSIGIALAGDGRARPEDLLQDAVTAMHRAKRDGTRCARFDPAMYAGARERLRLEADLHRALQREEFALHYQPIVSFRTGRLSAVEALLRWRHPTRGMVSPDVFVPIAEDTGQIVALGRWALEQACQQMCRWRERYPASAEVAMAVNISARQFDDPDLVPDVAACLERTGLEARALELEMTESAVMQRTHQNARTLQSLRDLGIRLLIDDFGTGYSSLASLQSFPLDSLKIDRSFVMGMEFEEGKVEIVRTILALARSLDLDVVAEGVETAEELAMLRQLDCHHGQGFYFSNAVDGESAANWMQRSPSW